MTQTEIREKVDNICMWVFGAAAVIAVIAVFGLIWGSPIFFGRVLLSSGLVICLCIAIGYWANPPKKPS